MGWFNTLLNVTSIAMDVAQYGQLQQLRQQGEQQQVVAAILQAFRNEIFRYRQAAEETLAQEKINPKTATYGMKLLEVNVQNSPITPEIFPDLSDKEYVATTYRYIRDNSARMMNGLTQHDKAEIINMVELANKLEDVTYYLTSYIDAQKLIESKEIVQNLSGRNRFLTRNGIGCGFMVVSFFVWGLLGSIIGFNNFGLILGIWIVVMVALAIALRLWIDPSKFSKAKKLVDQYDSVIDLDQFMQVDLEYRGDLEKARYFQQSAQQNIEQFLRTGSTSRLASPPISCSANLPPPFVQAQGDIGHVAPVQLCIHCGGRLRDGAKFCGKCGKEIQLSVIPKNPPTNVISICKHCNNQAPANSVYCPACGQPME